MENQDFTTTFLLEQSPEAVFSAINNIPGWWSEDFKGASQQEGDAFEVRFGEAHYSRQRVSEMIPSRKVAWMVTDSLLQFFEKKEEWTGTKIVFDISRQGAKTKIHFTHHGLVPGNECFSTCSQGWQHFLQSLVSLITTGKGQPYEHDREIGKNTLNA